MCDFRIDRAEILRDFAIPPEALETLFQQVAARFEDTVTLSEAGFEIHDKGRPLTRMIARAFDAYDQSKAGHSSAI